MTYTTQQLQAMSDFEVNKALCIKLGYDVSGISEQRNMMTGAVTDCCNNPSDIMPLAFERRLSLIDCVNEYICTNDAYGYHKSTSVDFYANGGVRYAHENPLRAIACLILMMDE